MKKITTLILTLISLTSFSQSIEKITEKISDKICECMSENLKEYSEIKPEFNRCYDKEFNFIFNIVDSIEHKILIQNGALEKVKNGIIPTLNEKCEKIRKLIKSDLESSTESSTKNPCPTNFESKDLKEIKKQNGEIVAFNGLVTKVHTAHNDKPYYQVKLEGGKTIWIASLVKSGFEKEGKILRLLGYISEVENDEIAKKYNDSDYHILAFCVIELENKQIAMMPGSELQVKEWMNGTIPKAVK
jgi:hypothetical protein